MAEPVPDAIPERCYIPAADPSFVAFGESLVRLLVAEAGASAGPVGRAVGATPVADPSAAPRGEPAQRAWFERQLRRRFPYASVEPALVRPGRTARGAWRVYRDGGPSQSLW
ncbi:MAG TPA: hypothetical protein VF763_14135 [Candidatus Limnocylindrales bacterium]